MPGYCNLHDRDDCTLCDECDHDTTSHIESYDHPTCWAESVCLACLIAAAD
jgi:hypothetical protein